MRRILSLAFLVCLVSAFEARAASYLFGLTEREIDEVMQHYDPKGELDRDEVLRAMSEPFDCRHFGDLCQEVGERYASQIVETAWKHGRIFAPIESIDRAVQYDLDTLSRRWFESNYPDGVPDRDPYFGEAASSGACVKTSTVTEGNFRVVHSSRRFITILFTAFARIKVEHFKKNLLGKWKPEPADRLEVEGEATFIQANFETFFFPLFDSKENVKQVADTQAFGIVGLFRVPFVEGCGGIPNPALFTCSCNGTPVP